MYSKSMYRALFEMMALSGPLEIPTDPRLKNIDLLKEYELIQKKKSKLSSSIRKLVVERVNESQIRCNNCYYKKINKDSSLFCHMFKKQVFNCKQHESEKDK